MIAILLIDGLLADGRQPRIQGDRMISDDTASLALAALLDDNLTAEARRELHAWVLDCWERRDAAEYQLADLKNRVQFAASFGKATPEWLLTLRREGLL